ncbi:SUKH superfamily protein [Planifilum fimeticola]|uniref:SUKH superfamily protein n=1 Tax=Planifilum fimeticola TaxID=201975 RepID=A0A2T0LCK9_9BACL|nr:SUKH superfamily protein [Planifilum fimeticola]
MTEGDRFLRLFRWMRERGKVEKLLSFHPEAPDYVLRIYKKLKGRLRERVFPVARLYWDDFLCLDYRKGTEPRIVMFDPEESETISIADGVEEFLASLDSEREGIPVWEDSPEEKRYGMEEILAALRRLESEAECSLPLMLKKTVLHHHGAGALFRYFIHEGGMEAFNRLLPVVPEDLPDSMLSVYRTWFAGTSMCPVAECPDHRYLCLDLSGVQQRMVLVDVKERTIQEVIEHPGRFFRYLDFGPSRRDWFDAFHFGNERVLDRSFRIDPALPLEDQPEQVKETRLKVEYEGGRLVLEVSPLVYPQTTNLRVSVRGEYREPLFSRCSGSLEEIGESIREALDRIREWKDLQVKERMITFPAGSVKSVTDRLLGEKEICWESIHPPVSLEQVEDLEEKWGVRLPDLLRDLMLRMGGGGPVPEAFEVSGQRMKRFGSLFRPDDSGSLNAMETFRRWKHRLPDNVFPFATCDGGLLCLDYRMNREIPAVSWYPWGYLILDREDAEILAGSLEEFLAGLQPWTWQWLKTPADDEDAKRTRFEVLTNLERMWNVRFPLAWKKAVLDDLLRSLNYVWFVYENGQECAEHFLEIDSDDPEKDIRTLRDKLFRETPYIPFAKCYGNRYLCHDFSGEETRMALVDTKYGKSWVIRKQFARFLRDLSDE